jgi:hypothetical protein
VRASWAIARKPPFRRIGIFVGARATSNVDDERGRGETGEQPATRRRLPTISTMSTKGAMEAAGIPILMKRPPSESGQRNFCTPSETNTPSTRRHEDHGRR